MLKRIRTFSRLLPQELIRTAFRSVAARNVVMALLYILAGRLSFNIFQQNSIVTLTAFLPEGFALAGVLLYGPKIIPGIFLGQFLLAMDAGLHGIPAAGIALVNSLEALIAFRLSRYLRLDLHLKTVRDLMLLTAMILFVLQPFSSLLGNGVLYLSGAAPLAFLKNNLFFWWFGNALGQLLVAPFLLLLSVGYRRINFFRLGIYVLGMASLNYLLQILMGIHSLPILMMITLPLLIHSVSKDILYGLGAAVSLALSTLWFTHNGQGLFAYASQDMTQSMLNLNFFILTNLFLALFVGILFREKEAALARLHTMAHEDPLTGLPNRHYLSHLLRDQVNSELRSEAVLCYLDLDGFKIVNDLHGHGVGDRVLKEMAQRIRTFLRDEDELLRLGGDEFLIVLRGLRRPEEADEMMLRLIREIQRPLNILEAEEIRLSASIGIIPLPHYVNDPDRLVSQADEAMYLAKKSGKGRVVHLDSKGHSFSYADLNDR